MSMSLTKKSVDRSSKDAYCFSFFCDRCAKEWRSAPIPFGHEGCSEVECAAVRDMLWAQEHRFAFERANLEAQFHFNHCPSCGRQVCDDCFHLGDKTDVCVDCDSS